MFRISSSLRSCAAGGNASSNSSKLLFSTIIAAAGGGAARQSAPHESASLLRRPSAAMSASSLGLMRRAGFHGHGLALIASTQRSVLHQSNSDCAAASSSPGAAAVAVAVSFTATATAAASLRGGFFGIFNAKSEGRRHSETEEQLRQQLPEVFDKEVPQEVQDYIRPDKTIFEKLEDYWDYASTFLNPVQKQLDWMRGLHDGSLFPSVLGPIEWAAVFIFWGFLIRLLSLGPMLYSHRNALRMSRINPQINEIQMQQKRLKADKTLSNAEKKIMKEGYKRMEKALYKKHGCSQRRAFVSGATTPFMISAFMAIRRLAMYEDSLETSSFLWVTDLTMPDPTMVLPVICGCLFVFNFEMNQSLTRGGRGAQVLYVRWGMRVGGFVFLYFFSSQPSALFAYWIGMSIAGMLQPVLLRWDWFRTTFNFPEANKVALQHKTIIDKAMDAWKYGITGGKGVDEAAVEEAQARLDRDGAKTVKAKTGGAKYQHISDEDVIFDGEEAQNIEQLKKRAEKGKIGFL